MTGSLGEELKLTIRGMLETAVGDCFEEFWLEQEISETGRVHSNVATLFVGGGGSSQTIGFGGTIGCCSISSSGICSLELLVGVIDEIFFVRHFDKACSGMSLNVLGCVRWESRREGRLGAAKVGFEVEARTVGLSMKFWIGVDLTRKTKTRWHNERRLC